MSESHFSLQSSTQFKYTYMLAKMKRVCCMSCRMLWHINNLYSITQNLLHLTHWDRVAHIRELTILGSDNGLSLTTPTHYLNQSLNIVDWALGNKFQRKFNRNSNIVIQQKAIENVVCEMVSILLQPQCVKKERRDNLRLGHRHVITTVFVSVMYLIMQTIHLQRRFKQLPLKLLHGRALTFHIFKLVWI